MKKLVLTLCLLFTATALLKAQGNLQFNQVILQDFSSSVAGWASPVVGTVTVPAGKVWKIEHAELWILSTLRNTQSGAYSLFVGNALLHRSRGGTGNLNQGGDHFPVWLPAGTYDIVISNENGTPYNYVGTINAIEFNVIP